MPPRAGALLSQNSNPSGQQQEQLSRKCDSTTVLPALPRAYFQNGLIKVSNMERAISVHLFRTGCEERKTEIGCFSPFVTV